MAKWRPLTVCFDEPEHHWLGISLTSVDCELDASFSYTPNDFVFELIAAFRSVVSGARNAVATASYNPDGYEFRFTRPDENCVNLEIQYFSELWTSARSNGDVVFSVSLPSCQMLRPFWLALTRLAGSYSSDEYEERMGHAFPARELELLGEMVKEIESRGSDAQ